MTIVKARMLKIVEYESVKRFRDGNSIQRDGFKIREVLRIRAQLEKK